MKMDSEANNAVAGIASGLLLEAETIIRDILEDKGEKFSGNVMDYLDKKSDKCLDEDKNLALFCMKDAITEAVRITTTSEIIR